MKQLKIAITGGIGSGKSTVSDIVRDFGYSVYDADKIYSELTNKEQVVVKISSLTSVCPKTANGRLVLDRKAVAEKVFNDSVLLNKLNEYTHALVYEEIDKICRVNDTEAILFFEIPLLFESRREDFFDKVMVVMRDKAERINAVKARSGLSAGEILARMKNQIDYDNFDFTKHTVIYNDGDLPALRDKVGFVIKSFRK